MPDELYDSAEPEVSGARHILGTLGLLLIPLLLVGAYVLRPEVTLLRLGAVAAALAVGHLMCEGLHAAVMSRRAAEGFTLHFGNFVLVVVLGTVLAIWWGWRSTAVVLLLNCAWHVVTGLLYRETIENFPKTTQLLKSSGELVELPRAIIERIPKTSKRLPPGKQ